MAGERGGFWKTAAAVAHIVSNPSRYGGMKTSDLADLAIDVAAGRRTFAQSSAAQAGLVPVTAALGDQDRGVVRIVKAYTTELSQLLGYDITVVVHDFPKQGYVYEETQRVADL